MSGLIFLCEGGVFAFFRPLVGVLIRKTEPGKLNSPACILNRRNIRYESMELFLRGAFSYWYVFVRYSVRSGLVTSSVSGVIGFWVFL